MNVLSQISIRAKLAILVVCALLSVMAVAGVFKQLLRETTINSPAYVAIGDSKALVSDILPPPLFLIEAHDAMLEIAFSADGERLGELKRQVAELRGGFERSRAHWVAVLPPGKSRATAVETSSVAAARWLELAQGQLIPAVERGERDKAIALFRGPMSEAFSAHKLGVLQVVKAAEQVVAVDEAAAAKLIEDGSRSGATVVVVAALLVAGVAFGVFRGISRSLTAVGQAVNKLSNGDFTAKTGLDSADELGVMAKELDAAIGNIRSNIQKVRGAAQRLAAGDLSGRVESTGDDELAAMARDLDAATTALRSAMHEVREAAEQVVGAAQQMSSGGVELSAGAQTQAASLEETSASLEEMTGSIKQTSDNAQQGAQASAKTRELATRGSEVAKDAITAMREVNDSSARIVDIITTIDEIAFQTNLLALNAAVEAARAGELGRGFAVVASEVRNLALRSATSAKEIKALIQDSLRKVDVGSRLVAQSGSALDEIVTSVRHVTDIAGEIAAASREQASGIDQVSRAMSQMDTVTQENAAQTEELSAAAVALSEEGERMLDLVARFKLDAGEGAGRSRATTKRTGLKAGSAGHDRHGGGKVRHGVAQASAASRPLLVGPAGQHASGRRAADGDDGFETY